MTPMDKYEPAPDRWPPNDDSGGGGSEDEPYIPSDERPGKLDEIDRTLAAAGQIPEGSEREITDEEKMGMVRERANEELRAITELPARGQAEIRHFLRTIGIPKAHEVSPQEVATMWERLNENASLIRDLTYLLISRDTKNNRSEYPRMPNMPEIMEYVYETPTADNPEDSYVSKLRPNIIKQAKKNLSGLGFNPDTVGSLASGTQGNKLAEEVRLVGWLAGFSFIKEKARPAIVEQMKVMGLEPTKENLTPAIVGMAFIVILDKEISDFIAQRKQFQNEYNIDRRGLEEHEKMLEALQGIKNLLYDMFTNNLHSKK